jgi:hypothetical protein
MTQHIPLTIGAELFNESRNVGLGVVVDVTPERVTTEDVSGKRVSRSRDTIDTKLETSGLEQRETPEWFN